MSTALLFRTSRFRVWSSTDASHGSGSGQPAKAARSDAATIVAVGAGRKVIVADVARVSILGYSVALDGPSLEKMDAEVGAMKGVPAIFNPTDFRTMSSSEQVIYPQSFARAAVFARIVSLMQSRSMVRSEVIEFLVDMLEVGLLPNFTSEATAGQELVAVMTGSLCCHWDGDIVSTSVALSQAGLSAVQLTSDEAATLIKGQFWSTGCACLITAGAANVMTTVDCIAALSCDTFGAYTDPYDSIHFDTCRQHRGQMASATNLRLLLEGSKRVNAPPADASPPTLASFSSIPQVNGPAQEMITSAVKALEIELNSCELGLSPPLRSGFDPTQSLLVLRAVTAALAALTAASTRRLSGLKALDGQGAGGGLGVAGVLPSDAGDEFRVAFYVLNSLAASLEAELATSAVYLSQLEGSPTPCGPSGPSSTGDDDDDKEKKDKGGKNLKPEIDESSLTPEQRAKAEAARKKKAEKAAQKNASKEAKKGGGKSTVVLGVGSTAVRLLVAGAMGAPGGGSGGLGSASRVDLWDPQGRYRLVNPFDPSDEGLSSFCMRLLERLASGGEKRRPKIPKGTRDYAPEQMRIREQVFAAIKRVFKRHGGVEIDTPVFELKDVLTGKYGEDSKLIYDLADQGGELLSLRYDLTVPFARFLAMNSVGNIKRYHIAKVYRRDQPQLNRGRYREFYQCDFDVAGSYSPMVPDAEVITVAAEILSELPVGTFMIKLNHRRLLDAIFDICGVPMEKFRPICSAVDKLDKSPWEEVKLEMVQEKGLAPEVADRIGVFVLQSGRPKDLWASLTAQGVFGDHAGAAGAMGDLHTLFEYLEAMGSLPHVSFDLSLARGLDYYTGVIYEVVLINGVAAVGSIAAGGRYDNLVGMFSPAGIHTPCVGVSIGVERVFTIIEKKAEERQLAQPSPIQVFIASIGAGLVPERMRIAQTLWKANLPAEYSHQENPKFKKQLDDCLERGIPFMVVFGSDELKKGVVQVKNMVEHTDVEIQVTELVQVLLAQGCKGVPAGADMTFLDSLRS